MQREFTGKHMAASMICGFGIIIAVNFAMAYHATSGFGGVIVENTYVASQKYNRWLEEAERHKALGWSAKTARDDDSRLIVRPTGIPAGAEISAQLRRPLGQAEVLDLTFRQQADGSYISDRHVPPGRWTIRLGVEANGQTWAQESPLS